jgi:predicted metalloprotease
MRWDDFRQSDNVEDVRGDSGGGGGGFGMPGGAGGLGIGTVLVLGMLGWALGIDPRLLISGVEILQGGGPGQYQQQAPRQRPRGPAPTDESGRFIRAVLGSSEDRWKEVFERAGKRYAAPNLVIFAGRYPSGCGMAASAMGPFYCPNDRKIYLDTSFFKDIETRFRGCQGKACRFSQAYVIAHEVGHHVQHLLGILPKVQQMQRGMDKVEANQLQVRVELQADCFAGVWAHLERQRRDFLEPGDVDAALQTAAAIGDDTLQRKAGGAVVPDSFTHGSAEQRKRWFMNGYTRGSIAGCNTFDAAARI